MSVLVVDKPSGPSSFAVVHRVRGALATASGVRARSLKLGHGGTLDPMASGVLPLCLGEATKLAPFLLEADKDYEAQVRFGVETDTLDAEGQVIAEQPVAGLGSANVEAALAGFRGAIEQVPPMYAALKRNGRPLYAYARAGETVERAPRKVTIHELVLLEWRPPDVARLRVLCSKGTYVRSLAADLGRALGPGAHLAGLRRLASGPFALAAAITLDALLARIAAREPLPFVSCANALAHLPALPISSAEASALRAGRALPWSAPESPPPIMRALTEDGALVAVVAASGDGWVRSVRVFHDDAPEAKNRAAAVDSTGVS